MKISRPTKGKLMVMALFLTAIFFCILWLSSKIDIGKYIKWSRLYYESHLYHAVDSMEDYVSGGDVRDWNAAAEQFHAFSVLMTESELRADVNPKLHSDADPTVAGECYTVSEAMLINREALIPYADDILSALKLLKENSNSAEAAKILQEIKEGTLGG